jgi:hypothetical protein
MTARMMACFNDFSIAGMDYGALLAAQYYNKSALNILITASSVNPYCSEYHFQYI